MSVPTPSAVNSALVEPAEIVILSDISAHLVFVGVPGIPVLDPDADWAWLEGHADDESGEGRAGELVLEGMAE